MVGCAGKNTDHSRSARGGLKPDGLRDLSGLKTHAQHKPEEGEDPDEVAVSRGTLREIAADLLPVRDSLGRDIPVTRAASTIQALTERCEGG